MRFDDNFLRRFRKEQGAPDLDTAEEAQALAELLQHWSGPSLPADQFVIGWDMAEGPSRTVVHLSVHLSEFDREFLKSAKVKW